VEEVVDRIGVHALEPDTSADELGLNDIGTVRLRMSTPLVVDDYRRNRTTGSFILIDESTNATVGAGMIKAASD
jgi:bifunctional enzyme CysN/CysC